MKRKLFIYFKIVLKFVLLFTLLLYILQCSDEKGNPSSLNFTIPEVVTNSITSITDSSAECGGTISSNGGATIDVRGVCWSTTQIPTISDNKTNDGDGTGVFTSKIIGLLSSTKYYVRAYATNSAGTGYGDTISFKTQENIYGTVTDIDGNVYKTIKIGNQWWMAENLKVTHYRNGDAIPNVTNDSDWRALSYNNIGAYCVYNNDNNNVTIYGFLYNWLAVSDSRNIAPVGWHVATDEEWDNLINYLGGYSVAGGKLKEAGTTHWYSPNTGATNESGFTALPSGIRTGDYGIFKSIGELALFWTSTLYYSGKAWEYRVDSYYEKASRYGEEISNGYSVRCVRD